MNTITFWLQDRLGWKVTMRDHAGTPMQRSPRWWNYYGRHLVRRYREEHR